MVTDAFDRKETGFLPNLQPATKAFGKKTGFLNTRASRSIDASSPKADVSLKGFC